MRKRSLSLGLFVVAGDLEQRILKPGLKSNVWEGGIVLEEYVCSAGVWVAVPQGHSSLCDRPSMHG